MDCIEEPRKPLTFYRKERAGDPAYKHMQNLNISNSIRYIGADDHTLDLFESQYILPNGVSYNSYIISDEQIAIMDTVDKRASETWMQNLQNALDGRTPDYLIISHMEPDHAANIEKAAQLYPQMKLVGSAKTANMLPQFFVSDFSDRYVTVGEGDTICLGQHTLQFLMAPMVHWPEVMVTFEQSEGVLFSADAFGKFGALDTEEDWTCEARRYYFNIVGKYGAQVQSLLKKIATLQVQTICPLHGPMLQSDLKYYLDKYDTWSAYRPEDEGIFIAHASIHGNTAEAAKLLKELLEQKGAKKVAITDLTRDDMAEAIEDAFRYNKLIVAASSYDGGVFPCMEDFLLHLKAKNYQNRTVAIMENGSWAPSAGRKMREHLEGMKNITLCDHTVSIRSTVKPETLSAMKELADAILAM